MIVADDTGTDWLTLADRLDELAIDRRWDCWNKHGDGSLDVPEGYDPSPDCCDAADGANALRAAADGLRQLADENRALREAILDAATELGLTHEPDWASDKAKADGKDPVWCRICGPADGSWPCTSQMVVTDLWAAADRGVTDGEAT